jgi:transcriptional regulator NrdR family protein
MKNCTECVHANWLRTKSGRLHPSGEGKCGTKRLNCRNCHKRFIGLQSLAFAVVTSIAAKN